MQKLVQNQAQKLALMQLWAADEMKKCAQQTNDPQLKKKYEQTAAINRNFYEQLNENAQSPKEKSRIQNETEILYRAYFLQNALFKEFSAFLTCSNRPDKIDEMCDRQVLLCREILDEADNRVRVISGVKETENKN